MRRRVVVSLIAALFAASPLVAQSGQISGTVTSSDGQRPLPGTTVSVVGQSLRAVTGPDGRYTITGVPAGSQRVTAAVIGHAPATLTTTVAAGQGATLNFLLQSTAVSLQGVVAIGYGERRVRDVTGSIAAVGQEQFNTGRVVAPEQLIQGKVAGVQVVSSGEPGGGTNIRIRGGTSVSASSEPLFVIDGVPLQTGGGLSAGRNPLNFINPQDIARVTVLKDASSTAIYGSRASNGVILIETRAGTSGPSVSYNNSFSTSRITREPELLNADQFRTAVADYAPDRVKYLGTANTDWRSAVERDAGGQEHSLSLSGAGTNLNYRTSLNYLDQTGVVRGSETERASGLFTYNHRLFDNRLNLRANVRGARTKDQFTPGAVLGAATAFDPTQPIRAASGGYFEQTNFTLAPNNPVAELALVNENGTTYRSVGNVEARYRMPFLDALTGTLRLGYDVAKSERQGFWPSNLQAQIETPVSCSTPPCPTGTLTRSNPTETTGLLDGFFTYQSRVNALKGDVEATAGYSYESTSGSYPAFTARGLSTDLLGTHGVPTAVENTPTLTERTSKLASFFGRVNYNLLDRYLFTASVRRDGSSRFGPANQWGTFPAAAIGWRLSEEPFFPETNLLSELKLRASWGVNGNQSFGDYRWVSSYTYSDPYARVQFGDEFVTTIRPSAVDENIKWEETTSYNLGLDYGLWDGRVSGAVDFYVKNTNDLLFTVAVPAGVFVSNQVTTNIGKVRNTGLELSLNAEVLRARNRGLSWTTSFNAATNKNRLLALNPFGGATTRQTVGGISGGVGSTIQVLQANVPVASYFVYQHKTVNGKPVSTGTDLEMYEDLNEDGAITQEDRRPFHSAAPVWTFGHTSNFGYRNLDLALTLRANVGNYVYNNTASSLGFYNNLLNAAGPVNLSTSVLEFGFKNPQYFSDVYVEDASFLRMDNITLGYTLPNFRGLDQLRLFGTVQNVFTLTGYDGVDPEAGIGGIDNNIYPRSRTFTAGVSIGF